MKEQLELLLDSLTPQELDRILPKTPDIPISQNVLSQIEKRTLANIRPKSRRPWAWAAVAACLVLALMVYGADVQAYQAAEDFFADNGLSTEGLSRAEVKAVYRDITTQRFTYDKTAEVLQQAVPGLEIIQKEPEELAALWNRNVWTAAAPGEGIAYCTQVESRLDEDLGFEVLDRGLLTCCRDGAPLWTASFTGFYVESGVLTQDGTTAAWGYTDTWSSEQPQYAWLARLDEEGTILWQHQIDHGFHREYIAAVVDNGDGTWAVISRGDCEYLCLCQYDLNGNELSFHKTYLGIVGIRKAVRLGEGYLVQLLGETARLAKLDRSGNIIDSFTYAGTDCDYYLTDIAEFGGQVYLSAYAVPQYPGERSRHEMAHILDTIFDQENWSIPDNELTPLVRENYTAVLLVCDAAGGEPSAFYSVKGSLGGTLTVNDTGELVWEVDSVVSALFSPYTSSFSIGVTCQVFRYAFDTDGSLAWQEDTGEFVPYYR